MMTRVELVVVMVSVTDSVSHTVHQGARARHETTESREDYKVK